MSNTAREYPTELSAEVMQALGAEFSPDEIEFLPRSTSGGMALGLPYIDARDVMRRLDAVVGAANWHFAFDVLSNDGKMVRGRLTVLGVEKQDAGEANQEEEPLKSACSDALKRCAVHFGIARYLYYLPRVWAPFDPQKRRFIEPPRLDPSAVRRALALCGVTAAPTNGRQMTTSPAAPPTGNTPPESRQQAPQAPPAPPESQGDRQAQQQASAGRRSPWAAGVTQESRRLGLQAQPAANNDTPTCSRQECGKNITRSQREMSQKNYGAPYCPACQKLVQRQASGQGYLGGNSSAPVNTPTPEPPAPAEPPPAAAKGREKDEQTRAREAYLIGFKEKYGEQPDDVRYACETVLLGWQQSPMTKGAKAEWTAGNFWHLLDLVKANRREPVLAAARELLLTPAEAPDAQPTLNGLAAS